MAVKYSFRRRYATCGQFGQTFMQLEQWEDAEFAWRRALAKNADDVHALYGLALRMMQRERFGEASELLLDGVSVQHTFASAHFQLGKALQQIGRLDHAIAAWRHTRSLRPHWDLPRKRLAENDGLTGENAS